MQVFDRAAQCRAIDDGGFKGPKVTGMIDEDRGIVVSRDSTTIPVASLLGRFVKPAAGRRYSTQAAPD